MDIVLVNENNAAWFGEMQKMYEADEQNIYSHTVSFGAVCEGCACGLLMAGIDDDMAEILWLYTAPDYRNRSVAAELLAAAVQKLKDVGVRNFMAVYPNEADTGYYLDRLMLHSGYYLSSVQSDNYSLSIEDMIKTPLYAKLLNKKLESKYLFMTLDEISDYMLKNAGIKKLYDVDSHTELSIAAVFDKKIVGQLLVRRLSKEEYDVSILKNNGNSAEIMLGIFCAFTKLVREKVLKKRLSPKARLSFQLQDGKNWKFLEELIEKADKETTWIHIARNDSV